MLLNLECFNVQEQVPIGYGVESKKQTINYI